MSPNDFIKGFVNDFEIESNRFSCLLIALTDARKNTGRNVQTGKHELNIHTDGATFINPHSFIGAINYLLILDMIGEVFKIGTIIISAAKTNNIYKALKYFSSTSDRDIDTIIALRNSLAHNYGLVNIPSVKEVSTKQHKFTLDNFETNDLIRYPTAGVWSGNFTDKSSTTSTTVSYLKLIDLIESVYQQVKTEEANGNLILALKDGIDELKARFTIRN